MLAIGIAVLMGCDSAGGDDEVNYVRGEVLIGLVDASDHPQVQERIAELGLEWKEFFEHLGVALVGVPHGDEQRWVERLEQEPRIAHAQLSHTNVTLR